jgi:hypothetical protein
MPAVRRLSLAVLLVVVLAACGVPRETPTGDSPDSTPSSVTGTELLPASAASLEPSATEIAPSSLPPSLESQPGDGEWPPTLLLTDLKDAGLVEVTVAGVRFQLPSGSTAATPASATAANYRLTTPNGGATGTAIVEASTAGGGDALTLLGADPAGVTRVGTVDIPGATSAAMAEAGTAADRSWILGVVTPAGDYVRAEFRAPAMAFDDLLIYPSLCSVKIG